MGIRKSEGSLSFSKLQRVIMFLNSTDVNLVGSAHIDYVLAGPPPHSAILFPLF